MERFRAFVDTSAILSLALDQVAREKLFSENWQGRGEFVTSSTVLLEAGLVAKRAEVPVTIDPVLVHVKVLEYNEGEMMMAALTELRQARNRLVHTTEGLILAQIKGWSCTHLITGDTSLAVAARLSGINASTIEEFLAAKSIAA